MDSSPDALLRQTLVWKPVKSNEDIRENKGMAADHLMMKYHLG